MFTVIPYTRTPFAVGQIDVKMTEDELRELRNGLSVL